MSIKYQLSNRQEKAALAGDAVRVAIPCPFSDDVDPLEVAEESLQLPDGVPIATAEYALLLVDPLSRGGGLDALLGGIIHRGHNADDWRVPIECVVVTIARRNPGLRDARVQWPGSVTLPSGRTFPREAPKREAQP